MATSTNLRSFPISRTVTEMPAVEQFWTIRQVAERLHAGESTVKRWLSPGASPRLEKSKAGDKTLVSESALLTFVKKCSEKGRRPR